MNDAHWRDRVLPGFDFKIHSYRDVLNLIAIHQTKVGLEYDPMNPHKPIASKVRPPSENPVITYYPPDEQQRTPLRYIPDFKQPRFPHAEATVTPTDRGINAQPSTSMRYERDPPDMTNHGHSMLSSISCISPIPRIVLPNRSMMLLCHPR